MDVIGEGFGPCYSVSTTVVNLIFYIIIIIEILEYVIPAILIILGIIDLVKANKSKNENKIKEAKKSFIIRIIVSLVVFLIPWILSAIIGIFADYTKPDWKTCVKSGWPMSKNIVSPVELKPVIYIYPEEETDIKVTIPNSNKLLVSYPKYVDGWHVKAYPAGTLIDNNTGRELYSLYYESNYDINPDMSTGFIVKGEDTIPFLEEKLSIIGLNDKEAEEFIVYWLPILQNNKYNYIYFASTEELNEAMPLEFSEEPDTLIRTLMMYKPLNKKINVKEQKLTKATRSGYTVIEWGGSLIK